MRTKEKTLRWAANEYTRQEQESFLKAKRVKLPVTLNPFDAFPTTSGNKTSVFPLPFSAFSLFSRAAVYLPITVEPLTKELTLDPEHYSDEVLKLQERLQELGYELEASGYFDSATLAVVNRYKEKYGLDNAGDRQGIVDENVWRTLFGTLSGLLTVQMHGQAYSEPLKMAQLRLQELGFEVEANGYFDEATVRALEGFREVYEKDQNGLEGVIGPATWQALFNMPKVEPIEEAKNEPQYFIMADDPRSYSLDDVLNRDDPEVQERLKQTCWADLTKEEQDRIYNELKELEKKEENEMRQKQSGIGNPLLANLIVGGSNAVVNTINTASAGLPELLAEWIMGPEPEGYVNPLDDPYGKGAGEAAGNVVGFFLPFKYLKAVKTPAALSKLSPTLVRSMTAGAIFGTATEASDAVTDFKNDGDQDLTGRAQNIALDTALAGAGDVTFTYAFKLISSALKSTAGQKLTEWLKRSEVDEVPATQGKLETPAPNNVAEGTVKAGPIKEVEIVDHTGKPIGELDEIDLKNGIFYEDKAAKGLNVINPKTGLPAQTPQQFTDKQILDKTRKRINNIAKATATRATKNGTSNIPSLDQIKGIRKFIFRLDGDTPELRQAVENSLEQLRKEFPDYTFDALFGGKK
ncbi:peptidoglycan-binding protein [Paenibacillus macerans]|uniref:peptidoglycan-binding domain-containing protein n=1 Tax=Paenibacillus macerans TaxID=44252 RepID=UPI002DB952E8|nr:peptidoglycan-binding protein [Paenibacillus macerans]MEC0329146.1 peptidoglycan-binding protein [Paenibacillus macerans]MED4954776.1 peptidoglycan-binding protein [Paenibacillus macerans]